MSDNNDVIVVETAEESTTEVVQPEPRVPVEYDMEGVGQVQAAAGGRGGLRQGAARCRRGEILRGHGARSGVARE